MTFSLRNYITAGAVFLALLAANSLFWHSPIIGVVLPTYFLLHGLVLGGLALPKLSLGWRLFFGTLAVVAFYIISGTAIYYLADFGPASIIIVTALPIFILGGWWSRKPKPLPVKLGPDILRHPPDSPAAALGILMVIIDLAAFALLDASRTTSAIRSPWEIVPWQFLLLFGLASAGLAWLAVTGRGQRILIPLAFLHTFIGLGAALTVYRLGFGFDPFIHQATEAVIAKVGVILPKTPYYIGQYVLVSGATRLASIPLDIIDRALVPIAAAILIPLLLYWLSRTDKKTAALSSLALVLPLPMFVLTTPQGFADLWLLLTAVAVASPAIPIWLPWLFALAAATIHPIAGVPALALAIFGSVRRYRFLPFIITVLALPFAFWFNARSGILNVEIIKPTLVSIFRLLPIPTLTVPNNFDLPLDLAYLLRWNIPTIITALTIIGIWTTVKSGRAKTIIPHIWVAVAMIGSYLIIRGFFRFPGVIAYEEAIFPQRLLESAVIVLVPIMVIGVMILIKRLRTAPLRVGAALLLSGMTVSGVYLSYPRVDRYEKSSGRSLSASMVHAVQFVEENAKQPYVVLADQNAAAAQIKNFGFGPYYQNSYFYSHPSGGLPLYRFYQKMVEDGPSRDTALAAMDFVGTDKIYFFIHDYWKDFRPIVNQAMATADDWAEVDGGKVYIFRYSRNGAAGAGTKDEIF